MARPIELVYPGKEPAAAVLAQTPAAVLRRVRAVGGKAPWRNLLIHGDNLSVLQTLRAWKEAGTLANADGSPGARLVYIDPPFATNQDFPGAYDDRLIGAEFLEFLRRRLVLLRELLSDNGTIYVHADWKMAHYVRVLLDEVFGPRRFINEIIWYYANKYGANSAALDSFHNTLFRYGRGKHFVHEPIRVPVKVPRKQPWRRWNKERNKNEWLRDAAGVYLYKDSADKELGDVWEVPVINPMAAERLGYPTQKPEALLDWVVRSSSRPGDLVLDAFAGSGTTGAVAEKRGRRWVAIDSGARAVATMQERLRHLRRQIGNKGPRLEPSPFIVYRAGAAVTAAAGRG